MNHTAKNHASLEEDTLDLEDALRLLRRENRTYAARAVGCVVCWFLALGLMITWVQISVSDEAGNILPLLLSLLCLVGGAILIPSNHSHAMEQLTQQQDTRAVAFLLNSLPVSNGAKAQAVRSLLTQLLPCLTPADANLLNCSHLNALWRELETDSPDTNLNYLLAILTALEHVGNRDTALRLRGLIALGAVTENQQHVREAAEKCLISLEARLEQQQISGTLLRAASSSQNDGELLHPAASRPDAQIKTLLQPVKHSVDEWN